MRRAREEPWDKVGGSGAVSRNCPSDYLVFVRRIGFGIADSGVAAVNNGLGAAGWTRLFGGGSGVRRCDATEGRNEACAQGLPRASTGLAGVFSHQRVGPVCQRASGKGRSVQGPPENSKGSLHSD